MRKSELNKQAERIIAIVHDTMKLVDEKEKEIWKIVGGSEDNEGKSKKILEVVNSLSQLDKEAIVWVDKLIMAFEFDEPLELSSYLKLSDEDCKEVSEFLINNEKYQNEICSNRYPVLMISYPVVQFDEDSNTDIYNEFIDELYNY